MNVGKLSQTQRQMLVEYLKQNNDLLSGKFTNTFTFKDAEKKWQEITKNLNSVPAGARKDWKSWRKTWQDIRSRTKGKLAKNKRIFNMTGGGPFIQDEVSAVDEEVLNLINPVIVSGHEEIEETMVADITEEEIENEEISEPIENTRVWQPVTTPTGSSSTQSTGRTLQKRGGIKLKKTERAVEAYESHLKRKLELKEDYYNKKLHLKQQKNEIARESADSLKTIAESLKSFVENM